MSNENENQTEDDVRAERTSLEKIDNSTLALASSKDDFSSISTAVAELDNMKQLAEVYVNSNLSPIKKVEDFIIAVITGNQLGLPFSVSINTIFPINGKPGMSVHLMRALLVKAGVIYEKTKDYVPIFPYFEAKRGENGNLVPVKGGDGNPILRGSAPYNEIDSKIFIIGTKPVDYITQYKFTRMVKQINGKYIEMTATASFTIMDSVKAGLDEKDNWKKYPNAMCDARAFVKGAREIASDVIFGLYSIDELADANDIPYTMDESFQQTIIDVEAQ